MELLLHRCPGPSGSRELIDLWPSPAHKKYTVLVAHQGRIKSFTGDSYGAKLPTSRNVIEVEKVEGPVVGGIVEQGGKNDLLAQVGCRVIPVQHSTRVCQERLKEFWSFKPDVSFRVKKERLIGIDSSIGAPNGQKQCFVDWNQALISYIYRELSYIVALRIVGKEAGIGLLDSKDDIFSSTWGKCDKAWTSPGDLFWIPSSIDGVKDLAITSFGI